MNISDNSNNATDNTNRDDLEKRIELLEMSQAVNLLGSWEWDLKTNKLLWTDAMFQLRAVPVSADNTVTIEENYKFVHTEDKEIVKEKFESLKQQQDVEFEYRIVTPNGEIKIVMAWASMFRDENGDPQFIRGTSQDITKLRHTEKQLRDLNHAFEFAEEIANMGNWQYWLNTNKYVFSNNFYRLFGCVPGEFEATFENYLHYVHPDDKKKVSDDMQMAIRHTQSYSSDYRIIKKDGDLRHVQNIGKLVTYPGGEPVMLGTTQDITEEIQMLTQLEEKISFAEMLIENSVDLIAAYDLNMRCIAWNRTCEERFNMRKEDVIGKHVLEIYPQLKGYQCINDLERATKGEFRYQTDQTLTTLEGSFEYYIIPLRKGRGEVFGALSITHDLSEFKKSAEKLKQLNQSLEQKNQELERSNDELVSFSYVASHDLQEPLRKIQTFSKLIMDKDYESISDQGKDYLKRMESASQRMQVLIDDLLTLSRTTTYPKKFAPADLGVILEQVKRELKDSIEEKNAVIESSPLPVALVIAFQFRQLLENLIINSIKYSKPDEAPRIIISSELVSGDNVKIPGIALDKNYHKISLADNGIGFDQQYSQRIFELFQRLHGKQDYPGTGLGLAICKKIVQNHNGFITGYGEIGVGSIFTVYIPVETNTK